MKTQSLSFQMVPILIANSFLLPRNLKFEKSSPRHCVCSMTSYVLRGSMCSCSYGRKSKDTNLSLPISTLSDDFTNSYWGSSLRTYRLDRLKSDNKQQQFEIAARSVAIFYFFFKCPLYRLNLKVAHRLFNKVNCKMKLVLLDRWGSCLSNGVTFVF